MCRPLSQGGRRCPSANGGAKPGRADIDGLITDADLDRTEADGRAWDALATFETDPLRRQLALVGVAGLAERWGFDHSDFEATFGPADLTELTAPGVPAAPEAPEGDGPEITMRRTGTDAFDPARDVSFSWSGLGDRSTRRAYEQRVRVWLSGLFAVLAGLLDQPRRAS